MELAGTRQFCGDRRRPGFVVDGGIYCHEFVAAIVIDAMMRVQLESEVPILSVVLTPQRFHEHQAHLDFFRNHCRIKGAEAAGESIANPNWSVSPPPKSLQSIANHPVGAAAESELQSIANEVIEDRVDGTTGQVFAIACNNIGEKNALLSMACMKYSRSPNP